LSALLKRIEKVIRERVEPLVALDGATVQVVAVDEQGGSISIELGGAYAGGPSRDIVLKYVIEPVLFDEFKEIKRVRLSI
jgi:Fe-S cluster biogenesis protein NfuA